MLWEVYEVIWRAVEAEVELWRPWRELRGQILDTFIKSEVVGGGPGAEGTGCFPLSRWFWAPRPTDLQTLGQYLDYKEQSTETGKT